jgi:hypothetical protein
MRRVGFENLLDHGWILQALPEHHFMKGCWDAAYAGRLKSILMLLGNSLDLCSSFTCK